MGKHPDACDGRLLLPVRQSYMIRIDGNGIFLILCLAAIIVGAVLFLKNIKKSNYG